MIKKAFPLDKKAFLFRGEWHAELRKLSPFEESVAHCQKWLSPLGRVAHSAERGHRSAF